MELQYHDEKNPTYVANKRKFQDFLDQDDDESVYLKKVQQMLAKDETRLFVNVNDLRAFDPGMAIGLLTKPMDYLPPAYAALKDFIATLPNDIKDKPIRSVAVMYSIGIIGSFGGHKVSPRGMRAEHLGKLMCVEGIVTKCSAVRPKVVNTVHYCEATNKYSENSYHDSTSVTGFATGSAYPTKDEEGNLLTTEFGLSSYTNNQTLAIQEMPEKAPPGQLPQSVDVVLDGDLVDRCKPGDRVNVVGIYRAMPSKQGSETNGLFRAVLIANTVTPLGSTVIEQQLTEVDIANIKKISKRKDLFKLLSNSIAPSIQGHDFIKRAIVLLMLGGVEKNMSNGHHLRGDINMLMMGDPSTAKSQMLRFILNLAPLAINTTGRGSSGVGLTAAVTTDENGDKRLEAGAMVLADRGIVCIDEFDKMSDMDRVAIHEVMEQQTVTIAKAGLHMSLNARCSVVAAANPRNGNYDSSQSPAHNVNLPDSLISRFDLLFILLDSPNPALDRLIAKKVLSNHRYKGKGNDDDFEEEEEEDEVTPVFQKFDKHFQSGKSEILSVEFLKKYIQYAKATYRPVLTDAAGEMIDDKYVELRSAAGENERALPITARNLESIIRLSSAHAKARLKRKVTPQDVDAALEVLSFALEHKESEAMAEDDMDESDGGNDDDDDSKGDGDRKQPRRSRKRRGADLSQTSQSSQPSASEMSSSQQSQSELSQEDDDNSRRRSKRHQASPSVRTRRTGPRDAGPVSDVKISDARLGAFRKVFVSHMRKRRIFEVPVGDLLEAANASNPSTEYTLGEVNAILARMDDDNQVMVREGIVHRI